MENKDGLTYINDINEALVTLNSGLILLTFYNGVKSYIVKKKENFLVINANTSYYLKPSDFVDLFAKAEFVIYEEKDEQFDFERDEQYYSWRHK